MHLYCGQVKQLIGLSADEINELLLAGVQSNQLSIKFFMLK
ncbi:hypothetical protein [Lysinibacillus xylanilyticus]|nr:hypothetical protein [Lysinibacillus xylanilyticus]